MTKSKWTSESVEQLMKLVRKGSLEKIAAFFKRNGYESLPGKIVDEEYVPPCS